jgi:hypothetical protein
VSYRRLGAPGLDSLLGAGVFYGAAASEAAAFAGEHVFIVGGANSAGQAAVNLARFAGQVTIVVRGSSLAARMSQYLIDAITATTNIDVRAGTRIAAAAGTGQLETLTLADAGTGATQTVPASALVVLIGAVPHTDWLPPQILRDEHGFILTGNDLPRGGTPAARWTLRRRRSRWNQHARRFRGRRRPSRLGQARRLRRRRRLHRHHPDDPVPAGPGAAGATVTPRCRGRAHARPSPMNVSVSSSR